jgi:polyphosphate kinase
MADTIYMNRELSWLKFNERVLEEAENPENPLCERLTFASIYQSNLDEFYMVRVGSLVDQMLLAKDIRENKTNMTPKEQLDAILARTKKLNQKRDVVYEEIMESLEEYGVHMLNFHKIEKEDRNYLERYFEAEVAPVISPSIVGKRQPFPFLRNKEIYAVVVLETKKGKEKLGIIPCSSAGIQRLIPVPGKTGTYMLSEELILHFVSKIFKGYHIKAKSLLRITRNADIDADALYDEDLDYREFMVELIKARKKLAPIRLELSREMDGDVVETLCDYLEVDKNFVFRGDIPLDLSFVFQIQDGLRKRTELFYEKRIPQKSPVFNSHEPILDQIAKKDRFLSYPYESIKPFLTMLHEAANDEDVVSIKMTLYRVAKQSKVVEALIEAADGKEVFVLVELKARFDEENNIGWSRLLEDAGCHVIYGLDGYKVHSKLCQIMKKKDGNVEYYTQIGTGNYNEKTARLYTDLSLMTADPKIGTEAARVFQALAMGETVEDMDYLLVAPKCLQNKVLAMIDEEIEHAKAGEQAYIGLKMNSLTDKRIMNKLVEASCAGVHIDMVVRGICCLIPGVKGQTENIHIISIVGRFLEHSRIYIFGTQERAKIYISSADFMTRNTLRRVEVAAPIEDPDIRMQIQEMFVTMLSDNRKARTMNNKGNYKIEPSDNAPLNSQEVFLEQAYDNAAPVVMEK